MEECTLCICYPTFNRGQLFIQDIKEVLSNEDRRLTISILDNCSDDGSYEELSLINDERLTLRKNNTNIGGIANTFQSVSNVNNADYILFCLDKDKVNPLYISCFIDFLEKEHPFSGFIDLYSCKKNVDFVKYCAGKDAMINTAYLSKHPSGFFWKRVELEKYKKNIDSNLLHSFPFILDLIQAEFALNYSSYIVYMPVVIHAPFRKDYMKNRPKTLTYNEENVYFSCNKRIEAFKIYLSHFNRISTSSFTLNYRIVLNLFRNLLNQVTIGLKKAYADSGNCWHYNVRERKISYGEMIRNVFISNKALLFAKIHFIALPVKIVIMFFSSIIAFLAIIRDSINK